MTLPALVARVTVILAATGRAPAARPVGELRGVLGSHAPRGNNDDDDNHDDNYCQDDHELSHRTIQHGMASQGGASEAHVAIDADLSPCASTLSNSRLNTLDSDSVGPLWSLSRVSRSLPNHVYTLRPDGYGVITPVTLPRATAWLAMSSTAAVRLVPSGSGSEAVNA